MTNENMKDDEFNISWGGAKVMISEPNVILMRDWIGKGNPEEKVIGINKLSDLGHLSAIISMLDFTEPTSCNKLDFNLKELMNLQTLDRVEKNEIPAIELMLRERYYNQGLPLIERLGAHLNRGFNLLKDAKKSIKEIDEITIFDILNEIPEYGNLFQKSVGITPIQTSIDNFI